LAGSFVGLRDLLISSSCRNRMDLIVSSDDSRVSTGSGRYESILVSQEIYGMWEKKCAEIKTTQWKGGNLPIKSVET
jgi:hypothetical protein